MKNLKRLKSLWMITLSNAQKPEPDLYNLAGRSKKYDSHSKSHCTVTIDTWTLGVAVCLFLGLYKAQVEKLKLAICLKVW